MSKNSSPSLLDGPQIIKRVFDSANDSIRCNLGDINGLSVSLSAGQGDSVISYNKNITEKVSLTSTSTGTILGPFDISAMQNINLYTNTTGTIVGSQACTLQISPSDTDNVWINTTLTVTPSLTSGTVVAGTAATNIVARRAQVVIASTITSGTFDLYAVAQGN